MRRIFVGLKAHDLVANMSKSVMLKASAGVDSTMFIESGAKALSGGTYDTQLSFIQSLTEAIKGVPNAILLASLPFSDREAGSQQGVKALRALEHSFRQGLVGRTSTLSGLHDGHPHLQG
jgi:hypothetical protein